MPGIGYETIIEVHTLTLLGSVHLSKLIYVPQTKNLIKTDQLLHKTAKKVCKFILGYIRDDQKAVLIIITENFLRHYLLSKVRCDHWQTDKMFSHKLTMGDLKPFFQHFFFLLFNFISRSVSLVLKLEIPVHITHSQSLYGLPFRALFLYHQRKEYTSWLKDRCILSIIHLLKLKQH